MVLIIIIMIVIIIIITAIIMIVIIIAISTVIISLQVDFSRPFLLLDAGIRLSSLSLYI